MPAPLSPLVAAYDHVLLDLDGCVWVAPLLTPRADHALAALRAAGKGVMFVTNDARSTIDEYVARFAALGVTTTASDIISAGSALQQRLADDYPSGARAVVMGAPAVHAHVRDAGLEIVDGPTESKTASVAVIAGHIGASYAEIRDATVAVLAGGAALLATAADATYPTGDGIWPGTGALVAAVQAATGIRAEVIGKPARTMIDVARARLGEGRALFVGDTLHADMAAAHAAGIDGALVLTGATTRAQAQAWDRQPITIAESLADLVLGPAQ